MDAIIQRLLNFLVETFADPRIVTVIIAIFPIVEARLAIPMAINMGLTPVESWFYGFLGSTLAAPILLLVLIPFIKFLSRTKLFKKAGAYLYAKFEKKSKAVSGEDGAKKSDFKKCLGVFAFVAIPMPLTGVWTGSAVASILGLSYPKALASVAAGNLVASGIIALLCSFLSETVINYVILAISIIAVVVLIALIIKIAVSKPPVEEAAQAEDGENEKTEDETKD